MNARSGRTASAEVWPSAAATWVRTSSTSTWDCSDSGSAAIRRASEDSSTTAAGFSATSGRSARNGLGRAAVKTGANRAQSTSATVTAVSSSRIAWRSAVSADAVAIATTPRRRSCSAASPSTAMPASAHGPQETASAVRPRARRDSASASRWALAAA